jgi:hypothetical protein
MNFGEKYINGKNEARHTDRDGIEGNSLYVPISSAEQKKPGPVSVLPGMKEEMDHVRRTYRRIQRKITGYRVTDILLNGPKMEVSFKQSGKLLGVDAVDRATYWSMMAGPDTLYGEGAGTVISRTGEMAMYRATGTAKMKGPMPVWRGVLYFQSQAQKWAALIGVAVVYEYEIDENENTHVKLWEWK